jgi:succinate dehydrogenase / fumarate reductase cytochrome b subunit
VEKGAPSLLDKSKLKRAHSISGVLPLGAFLALHVLANATALDSDRAFLRSIRGLESIPGVVVLELVFVVLPLLFHAGYGIVLTRDPSARSPYPKPFLRILHVTGYVTFAFVLVHFWQLTLQKWTHAISPLAFHTVLEARLSSTTWGVPWLAIGYMIGIACACVHLAIGMWGFSVTWNLSRSKKAKRRVAWTSGAVGVVLFLIASATVVRYATGSNIITTIEPLPDGPPRPACSQ